ncbi:MAG TPA: PHB depolymerase family esterase [Nevskia sp.]|nr:PHB depolymerase family esterase [Nevskia sp.]
MATDRHRHRARFMPWGLALLLAACTGSEPVSQDTDAVVRTAGAFGTYRGLVYVPGSVSPDAPAPLVVVLHGANTTAEQQRAANLFDPLAARERFIVLYPDNETDGPVGEHLLQAWHFYDPAEMVRGVGDPQAIADLTQQVMAGWNVDPERVYVVGMSAGGWETSIMGATYPDLYAAIGIAEGGAYGIGLAGVGQPLGASLTPPQVLALAAYAAMGPYARIVPVIDFQGAQDPAATPASGANAVQQWLMTDNLAASGALDAPFPLTPTRTADVTPGNGRYPYHIDLYEDGDGCRVLEQVRIEQMQHFWPGGSSDPRLKGFTDPRAPSGAELSWGFFKRFRKSDTALPCVESR